MDERPNLIFINVDQWRADALGYAGHPAAQTPHLDALRAEGVAFTQAYAAVPSCIAARASLLTGLTPRHHGRVGYRDRTPWTYPVTLPGLLAQAGYHTQGVGKMHFFPARSLLGFHNVVLHDGYLHTEQANSPDLHQVDDYLPWLRDRYGTRADYLDSGIGCNGYVVAPWPYDTMAHPSAWVTTEAIDFLRRRDPGRPFYLNVSYHRPHPPLDPPAEYLALYDDVDLPAPRQGDWTLPIGKPGAGLDSPHPVDAAQVDRARRAYYAQLTFIDHQINRLVHALHRHRVLDNSLILFCADHGEMLYDFGLRAKSLPYDGSARVPFFIRFPRGMDMPRGGSVDAPVELRDVLPTLCDAAGVPVPDSVDGRSLLPLCRGESAVWRDYIHGEHAGAMANHWITDGRLKYVWYSQSGHEQLFDLVHDPEERHDAAGERPHDVEWLRGWLIDELTGREEGYVAEGRLVPGRRPQATLAEAGLPV